MTCLVVHNIKDSTSETHVLHCAMTVSVMKCIERYPYISQARRRAVAVYSFVGLCLWHFHQVL
jgi:hypothetical protein